MLVPWHHRVEHTDDAATLEARREAALARHGVVDAEKHAVIYQRYCHVYAEGELARLFEPLAPWVRVVRAFADTGNQCVEAERIA